MFRNFVTNCELIDIGFVGQPNTWCNRRSGRDTIRIRLDRVLGNAAWCLQFPKVVCYHLPMIGADHCPLLVDLEDNIEKGKKRFVFDNRWVGKEGCDEVIKNAWAKEVSGSRWYKISEKIKNIAYEENSFDHEEVLVLEKELNEVWGEEEQYWQQWAKFKHLKEGDRNTKFFHALAMVRRRLNLLMGLHDNEGVWREGSEAAEEIVLDYFGEAISAVEKRVTNDMNNQLVRAINNEEVKRAVFEMPADKSPGPDGVMAYDRVEWPFLEAIMLKLGFCRVFVDWVMCLVLTVSYSFLINRTPKGFLKLAQDIRQVCRMVN
ncbi:hypothetical protein LIER_18288 [Lithospermum erythrorhizon]|uniref:Reverse transcriptase n=1 Tax=Lithospermum erythrorhizon TaxID=34254 RepID=A0AAV3QDD7_LITER